MEWYKRYRADFKKNWELAIPIMLGQLGQIGTYLADNIMVGQLGAHALASVSLSIAIFAIPFVVGIGLSFALPPLVSEADGSGDYSSVPSYFKHSLLTNVLYSMIGAGSIIVAIQFLPMMGQEAEVVDYARSYLYICAWSMIPTMLFQTFRAYSDGLSNTKIPMIAMIIGNVINIALNYVLIYGKFGVEAYGVSGAAMGTFIARVAMLGILIYLLARTKLWHYIRIANYMKYQWGEFVKIIKLGVPSSLQLLFETSAFAGVAVLMGRIGAEEQAAHQIAINLASISFMLCSGLSMAASVRVGNNLGMNKPEGMRRVGESAFLQVTAFMAVSAIMYYVFRHYFPTFYIQDPEVVNIAAMLLILAAIFQIPDGLQIVIFGALRGAQDVRIPTLITFISYWLIAHAFGVLFGLQYRDGSYRSLGRSGCRPFHGIYTSLFPIYLYYQNSSSLVYLN